MKVLTLDIETAPMEAYVWHMYGDFVSLDKLNAPTRMLSWAAKWENVDEVVYASERTHTRRDMVLDIWDLVDEADAIVHFNGTSFDMKHLNREFVEQELDPPSNYKNIDLLTAVKRRFKFPSNKLDYVAGVLLGEHKIDTGGFDLWRRVLDGEKAAWMEMEAYNCRDVELTERLYHRIQGWIVGHPNRALWVEDQENPHCPNCGSSSIVKRGIERPARVNAYQRYKCNSCGANSRGREVVRKAGKGVLM